MVIHVQYWCIHCCGRRCDWMTSTPEHESFSYPQTCNLHVKKIPQYWNGICNFQKYTNKSGIFFELVYIWNLHVFLNYFNNSKQFKNTCKNTLKRLNFNHIQSTHQKKKEEKMHYINPHPLSQHSLILSLSGSFYLSSRFDESIVKFETSSFVTHTRKIHDWWTL